MNNNKYLILVSIIAFISLSYIFVDKITNLNFTLGSDQYATVMISSSTNSVSASSTLRKYILPPEAPTNYTDNKNGTISDNYTGLIWKKCPQGLSGNDCKVGSSTLRVWSKARTECEDLNFANKTGWRMPTLKELQSIVDTSAFDPSINKMFFIATEDAYWTLTSPAEYPSSKFRVIFSDGSVYYSDSNNFAATRCVHDTNIK